MEDVNRQRNEQKRFKRSLPELVQDQLLSLAKGANITTDVLLKICEAMDCKLEDIMETIKD